MLFVSVPSAAPQNFNGRNKSSDGITVTWQNVLGKDRNGIIIGFKIFYRAVGEFAENETEQLEIVNDGSAGKKNLGSLEKYMKFLSLTLSPPPLFFFHFLAHQK